MNKTKQVKQLEFPLKFDLFCVRKVMKGIYEPREIGLLAIVTTTTTSVCNLPSRP
jgi:hypothetical protein